MSRLEKGVDPQEKDAADAITNLAEKIELLCDYLEGEDISPATVSALSRVYRVLKPIVEMYHSEEESPLSWDAPYKFQKAKR